MQVTLPPDIEAIAQQAAKDSGYDNIADFIAEAVRQSALGESLKQEQKTDERIPAYKRSYPEWKKLFDDFLANRQATNPNFDDSRESMYPDRS